MASSSTPAGHAVCEILYPLTGGTTSCAGSALKEMAEIKRHLSVCTSILDTAEGELTEDLNGCVVDWIREKLGPPPGSLYARPNPLPLPLPIPPPQSITIGVHVRWGDTASSSFSQPPTTFRGSMSIHSITSVLSDIRAALGGHANATQLTIAMENADHRVLAQLGETGPYTILDSGDGLADLRALSQNDVLLLGESSYGVLVHLIAPPGLSIVELDGDRGKYSNTSDIGRDLVFLGRDYSVERLRASLFGERS
ncbi:hypothetical protein FB45DRAFT_214215 [Roridomyces roridus]|uniref:Uncharacterized protein n=1 Tax=Roridomyces roridus TaxID=1738132 RepID=A0AAD7BDF4_9AGAR|nr:hypothetical protein FB45DRAFT_214215 [Roridomyces roridus]